MLAIVIILALTRTLVASFGSCLFLSRILCLGALLGQTVEELGFKSNLIILQLYI